MAGTLTVLAASPQQEAREAVRPVLEAVGTRTVWLDEVGQPSSLKLAYNAWVLTTVEGIAESSPSPAPWGWTHAWSSRSSTTAASTASTSRTRARR